MKEICARRRCGHERAAHRHYEHGDDYRRPAGCALCGCWRFRGAGWAARVLRALLP